MRLDKDKTITIKPGVFLVWKELGDTPLQALDQLRTELNLAADVPMTYAGRLDPAAAGQLLVLVGEACKQKDQFLDLEKTYQFTILPSFTTDTLDVLGLVTESSNRMDDVRDVSDSLLSSVASQLPGSYNWPYPAYSSRPVAGRPLWQWARQGGYQSLIDQNLVPGNQFLIKTAEYLGTEYVTPEALRQYILDLTNKVTGDFRQSATSSRWQTVLQTDTKTNQIPLWQFQVRVTVGTYVRQISAHIADKLGILGTTYHLVRTNIHL